MDIPFPCQRVEKMLDEVLDTSLVVPPNNGNSSEEVVRTSCRQDDALVVQEEDEKITFLQDKNWLFPFRLHHILDKVDPSIMSWLPDEDSFKIHNRNAFIHEIMPHYFPSQTNIKSFVRQLHNWQFQRILGDGPNQGGYNHPLFVRNQPLLCQQMRTSRRMNRKGAAHQKKKERASTRDHSTTPRSLPPSKPTKEQETLSSHDVCEILPFPGVGGDCPLLTTKGDSDMTGVLPKHFFLDKEKYYNHQHEQESFSQISREPPRSLPSPKSAKVQETPSSNDVREIRPFPVVGGSCLLLTKGDSDITEEPPKQVFLDNEEYDTHQHEQEPRSHFPEAPFSFSRSAENSEKQERHFSCEGFFDDLKYILIGMALGGDPLFDPLLTPDCQT